MGRSFVSSIVQDGRRTAEERRLKLVVEARRTEEALPNWDQFVCDVLRNIIAVHYDIGDQLIGATEVLTGYDLKEETLPTVCERRGVNPIRVIVPASRFRSAAQKACKLGVPQARERVDTRLDRLVLLRQPVIDKLKGNPYPRARHQMRVHVMALDTLESVITSEDALDIIQRVYDGLTNRRMG